MIMVVEGEGGRGQRGKVLGIMWIGHIKEHTYEKYINRLEAGCTRDGKVGCGL